MLLTEAGGETASDYESDPEEFDPTASGNQQRGGPKSRTTKEGDMFGEYAHRRDRIFKYIRVLDKAVRIPDLKPGDEHKMNLFLEIDDVLLHSFICDENFGYISNPAAKDPEHEFFIKEIGQPCLVYMRDNWQEFLDYLRQNEEWIDPIVFTQGMSPYTNELLKIMDPDRSLFKTILYQNSSYVFEIKEEKTTMLIKDVSRFRNRDIRRSLLLDPNPLNFMMTPENGVPVLPYTAEYDTQGSDGHLLDLI